MSFQKYKTNIPYVGQKHYSGTKNIVGEMTFNEKTGSELKLIVGQNSVCIRKKSTIVSDNTIHAEGFGDFFKNLGKRSFTVGEKLAKNVFKNLGRALDIGANVGSAFASRRPKAAFLSLPEVINFYHTEKGLLFSKNLFDFIPSKWSKEQID